MSAPGLYTRQKANHINFVLTAQYFSKNKRYGVIANFTINRLKNNENGGIKYDSLFEQNIETNRQVIPVNLATAQNRIRESGFFMKHYFDLTRHPRNEKDTTLGTKKRIELGRLTYSFQYNRQIQNYIDNQPDSGFYPYPLLDTKQTVDSVTIIQITNDVVWSNPSFRPNQKLRVFQISAGIRQQYSEVYLHD
ncbi:MAG: putative porin, partial [Bacteroidota bacterium]